MSVQDALRFTERLMRDPDFHARAIAATESRSPVESAAALVALGETAGLRFTAGELVQARRAVLREGELSLDELAAVAAGTGGDDALLGHELTHLVQQSGGAALDPSLGVLRRLG